jgi:transposase
MKTMTRPSESTAMSTCLLLAFELGERKWKVGFTTGFGQAPRIREIPAGAVDQLLDEIRRAKTKLHIAPDAPVISCYEAGRDGFWLHRYLLAHGITNYVVDSSSIEVNRKARRAKTDRLDLGGLLTLLARYRQGDERAWHVVRVPSVSDEDARHLHRMWETVQHDRTRVINRIKGLLVTMGLRFPLDEKFVGRLELARLWDGKPVPDGMKQRLTREWDQLRFLETQREELDAARMALKPDPQTPTGTYVITLQTLRAIGPIGAWMLATEIFGWREIHNGRELGALIGLVPSPFQSSETAHEQGISRAGNKHVRRLMVQLAWSWLHYQPQSALSQWYHTKFGKGGRRLRRIGIVALARKLLIALWRYVETGTVPEGAILKSNAVKSNAA